VLLPESCSVKVDCIQCKLPPTHVVSVQAKDGEYMVAVVCDDHMTGIDVKLRMLQMQGSIPEGRIHFQPVLPVVTECVTGMEEDYVELELKRGLDSERKA
jgi:hypothetical protein